MKKAKRIVATIIKIASGAAIALTIIYCVIMLVKMYFDIIACAVVVIAIFSIIVWAWNYEEF